MQGPGFTVAGDLPAVVGATVALCLVVAAPATGQAADPARTVTPDRPLAAVSAAAAPLPDNEALEAAAAAFEHPRPTLTLCRDRLPSLRFRDALAALPWIHHCSQYDADPDDRVRFLRLLAYGTLELQDMLVESPPVTLCALRGTLRTVAFAAAAVAAWDADHPARVRACARATWSMTVTVTRPPAPGDTALGDTAPGDTAPGDTEPGDTVPGGVAGKAGPADPTADPTADAPG